MEGLGDSIHPETRSMRPCAEDRKQVLCLSRFDDCLSASFPCFYILTLKELALGA
jgi:hypothetical protein